MHEDTEPRPEGTVADTTKLGGMEIYIVQGESAGRLDQVERAGWRERRGLGERPAQYAA